MTVYIKNANGDNVFSSLLMNDLNDRNVRFNNMDTTTVLDYGNVLIYIPDVGIGGLEPYNFYDKIKNHLDILRKFKYKIIVCNTYVDYNSIRLFLNGYFGINGFRYYQTLCFDTTCSRIISNEAMKLSNRSNKFHNK